MRSVCVTVLVLLPAIAAAQGGKAAAAKSAITLAIPGLNCSTAAGSATFNVDAWSWGASNAGVAGTGGGTTTSKPSISDLHLTKAFDACSPVLLGLVTKGLFMKEATLTQKDADGVVTGTVFMQNVRATSWQVSSSTQTAAPAESASLTFGKVCITDPASNSTVCFDQTTLTTTN